MTVNVVCGPGKDSQAEIALSVVMLILIHRCLINICLRFCHSSCLALLVSSVSVFLLLPPPSPPPSFFLFFFFFFFFFVSCGKFGSPYLGEAQQPQEQRDPFLSVCAVFSCVQTMVRLPGLGIFNVCTEVDECDCTQGAIRTP